MLCIANVADLCEGALTPFTLDVERSETTPQRKAPGRNPGLMSKYYEKLVCSHLGMLGFKHLSIMFPVNIICTKSFSLHFNSTDLSNQIEVYLCLWAKSLENVFEL